MGERAFIMSDFKPIETQEEFDKAVQARIQREQEALSRKYADYDQLKTRNTELETQVGTLQTALDDSKTSAADYDKQLNDLNTKVAGYETANLRTRIALQHGLPYDSIDLVQGTDEASIKSYVERLAGLGKSNEVAPPMKSTEQPLEDDKNEDYKALLQGLKLEGE